MHFPKNISLFWHQPCNAKKQYYRQKDLVFNFDVQGTEAKFYAYTDASSADLSFYESLQYIGYVRIACEVWAYKYLIAEFQNVLR